MVPVTGTRKIWMAGRLSMLVIGFLALSIPAAGAGPQYMEIPAYQAPNLTGVNGSLLNSSPLLPLPPTLRPITLLHLELNETTPSGVRYMAFGPKVIEIAMNPILIVILAILAACGAAGWYILGRRRDGG